MNPKIFLKFILASLAGALIISACGGASASPTPTDVSLEALYTAAAATVFANQTGTAAVQPSPTTTPTVTASPTVTTTVTPTIPRAVIVPAVQPLITAILTTTGTPGTATPNYGAVGGKNSSLVSESSVGSLKAGESFTKTWTIKNTGTIIWNGDYKFFFSGGALMGSDTTKIRTTVGPGGTFTQSLRFTAPSTPGTYTGTWRMLDDAGNLFGAGFTVIVTVPGATYTPAAATATTASTATPNAAQTLAAVAGTQTAVAATQTAAAAPTSVPPTATEVPATETPVPSVTPTPP